MFLQIQFPFENGFLTTVLSVVLSVGINFGLYLGFRSWTKEKLKEHDLKIKEMDAALIEQKSETKVIKVMISNIEKTNQQILDAMKEGFEKVAVRAEKAEEKLQKMLEKR